jgi:3-hydroxyisobutyrate dehydrogenase
MGILMIERLIAKGHEVFALDPVPGALRNAQKLGAYPAEKIENMRDCTHIVLSLPAPKHVKETVNGPEGILRKIGGQPRTIIDTSTIDMGTSIEMSNAAEQSGSAYLDAPILGRPAAAASWVMPVGGARESFDRTLPLLETLARKAFYIGDAGSGIKFKLINQIMFATINVVYCEAFTFAEKSGIGADLFYQVLEDSGASTVSSLFKEIGRRIIENDFSPSFSIDLLAKDVRLSLELVTEIGGRPMATGLTNALVQTAKNTGYGDQDNAAIYRFLSDLVV